MSNYKLSDFAKGDCVYHETNREQKMIVTALDNGTDEIVCEWSDSKMQKQIKRYSPFTLIKCNDTDAPLGIYLK